MAENCTIAFGRYLRTLRERRGLSLDQVHSLSRTFPEQINKGYLSRCENGHQKLAFPKVIALSRIYEVPSDVLLERMELDLELEQHGGPTTEGKKYCELVVEGTEALRTGFIWNAYGLLRDAVQRSSVDPVRPSFRDRDEQVVIAQMNCATPATRLGRRRYALHEYLYLHSTGSFGPKHHPVILERISGCYRALGDLEKAVHFADGAIAAASQSSTNDYLGYTYHSRAHIALDARDLDRAVSLYQRAYDTYKAQNLQAECAGVLNSLAQCYFDMKRYRAARRTSKAAEHTASDGNHKRSVALSLILQGEIDEIENRPDTAVVRWKSAATIAKAIDDKELRFKAEFVLFRRAIADGDASVARAIKRRLDRLCPWLSEDTMEVHEFKRLISS